ncbi:MAG TPA: glycosyltransferase [Bryobacteraceae bacterium]|nr:glycosyltransferase [Bryobacteraceae bacterium]
MQIAFFGSSLLSSYWNGAATYYRGIIRELNARGHRITFYEPDAYGRQQHLDVSADLPWVDVSVYDNSGPAVLRALEQARSADLIVKASGVGVNDQLLEREVLRIRRAGASAAFWDVDAPATLDRVNSSPGDPFRELIPKYDVIFTYGGGEPVVRGYQRLGAKLCVPIYNGLDPQTHHPVPSDPAYAADLSFLGNRLPDREQRVEEFFLKAASLQPALKFLFAGSGWQDKPVPSNVQYIGHLYSAQHNAFNCSARAVLNVTRDSMAKYGFSPATRVFEAAGAGACLISDNWEGIEMFLEPGREILVAQSGQEVADILARLSPAQARSIGAAALARVLKDHTYAQRAQQVDAILRGSHLAAVG